MTLPDYIDLHSGSSRWLSVFHTATSLLAGWVIVLAHSPWAWKVLTILALLLIHFVSAFKMRRDCPQGPVRLFRDGSAMLELEGKDVTAVQGEHAWTSRWICVFPLRKAPGADIIYCMVCASNNHPGNYRQLLAWLRMRNAPADHGFIW